MTPGRKICAFIYLFVFILNICRTLSVRSKKEGEKDLKICVSVMLVSCAHVFLHIYFTIKLIKNECLCTKGAEGRSVAYWRGLCWCRLNEKAKLAGVGHWPRISAVLPWSWVPSSLPCMAYAVHANSTLCAWSVLLCSQDNLWVPILF